MATAMGCVLVCAHATAASTDSDDAALFGALETVNHAALSPSGRFIVYTGPGTGGGSKAVIVDPAKRTTRTVARADGNPLRLSWCGWSAENRLVCQSYGMLTLNGQLSYFTRLFTMGADGSDPARLGERESSNQLGERQYDADVIDWLNGATAEVLLSCQFVPEFSTGTHLAHKEDGLAVVRVDTRTLKEHVVEKANPNTRRYFSDGRGNVRLMTVQSFDPYGRLENGVTHYYRRAGDREWQVLGTNDEAGTQIEPLAVDSNIDVAYVLRRSDGRWGLYEIALDGSMRTDLVFARNDVDIDGIVTIGRGARVIGATFATDVRQVEYFDPAYRRLAESLAKALPKLPLIRFVGASADERRLLVFAGSDVEAGRYYVFDQGTKHLEEVLLARPELDGVPLAPMRSITYRAADGVAIPAYLTLPPNVARGALAPAIVMPHGGPSTRDEWGFDWLAQFLARRGFVVLQPNYRGSAGYGDDWFVKNGFQSWKTAVGDVDDGARWLIAQHIADPQRIAIVGWSYGGYVALQSSALDPDLFKAVIAIAPVTDLASLKQEFRPFTNSALVAEYIGSGPHIDDGSPARHADRFKAPVLMFHGDSDRNVSIDESRAMDSALRAAGKRSELVVYPKLDHSLLNGESRADLLRRTDAFLRTNLQP